MNHLNNYTVAVLFRGYPLCYMGTEIHSHGNPSKMHVNSV